MDQVSSNNQSQEVVDVEERFMDIGDLTTIMVLNMKTFQHLHPILVLQVNHITKDLN
jgi:hypothetical protein